MLRTLHGKLSAVLLVLLVLSGLLMGPLTLFTTRRYLQETTQRLNRPLARSLAEHLAARNLLKTDARTRAASSAEIKRLMVLNPDIEIYLLDPSGAILTYSAAPGRIQRTHVGLEPLRRFLRKQDPLPLVGDDPRDPTRRKIFSAASLPTRRGGAAATQTGGYVYIILGGEESDSVADLLRQSYIARFGLLSLTAVLLLVLVTGLYLFRALTRPLRKLSEAMEGLARQNASPQPALSPATDELAATNPPVRRSSHEIDRLGAVFEQMTARIESQVSQLEQADMQRQENDQRRRELISNVSHDLRTPLATLQGYLETLSMKEGRLTPEEQRNYLEVATRHGARLAQLVSELFEMANLDAHDVPFQIEPFLPSELIQDVAQKFRLAAQDNKVRIETDFAVGLPFVCADIGLIERVLDNLLENALRYTPENGVITLALAPQDANILVEVSDTGSGIPKQDLPNIFDRYYRAGNQPPAPNRSGLGLAIAKRILEMHGSVIQVRSAPGQGATFTFSLPICLPAPRETAI